MSLLLLAALFLHPIAAGLDSPVQVVSSHDGSGFLYVALQRGEILQIDPRTGSKSSFLDFSSIVDCCSNGGLLSVVFHPRYRENGQMFVLYVNRNGDTTVARYLRNAEPLILFVAVQPKDNIPNHHGGTLQFGPDGFLYITIGDGGAGVVTNRAQETGHLLGKLLRIDVDHATPYVIPPDNPFVGVGGARGEIWSLGLRNPWRFSFDRLTGELLIGDVGQSSWEEIDDVTIGQARGANFGWPIFEGDHCFPPGGPCQGNFVFPEIEYSHDLGCSVTGGYRYRGSRWPALFGTYLYGDYCSGRIWGDRSELLHTNALVVSFGEDDAGELYLVDQRGSLLRIDGGIDRRRAAVH
jgi:glucose/arabinose dehydrogenase